MCGICAVFNLNGSNNGGGMTMKEWRKQLLKLSKMLRHRGPDWNGIHSFRNCILAHERLSINGLHSGAQPITNRAQNVALSVNGEIYNHKELLEELKEIVPDIHNEFTTDSDCEVLLHLFQVHGREFLEKVKVNGMYAFVAYDEEKDEYFVARDPVGIIPLYMGWGSDGSVWFASEMKALQENCDHFEVFPPGHYYVGRSQHSTCSQDGIYGELKPFYKAKWFVDHEYIPTKALDLVEFKEKFTQSVRRHLLAEVPFGVLLSGGLDSSLVSSIACREYKKAGHLEPLKSFCIGLKGSPDIAAAEKVAKFLGTDHFSFTFTVQQGLDAVSDVIYHLETFDVTTVRASTPMFLLSRALKATGCKMVLSGEGADEIFAGYLYFHKAPNGDELHKESSRKVRDLHKYDCLRANKSTMGWGVEARVPFLDREFLEYAMEIQPEEKMCREMNGKKIEKFILRKAFDDENEPYLPHDVLWRQKEQFSDGVGYSWIDSLKQTANETITDLQMKFAANRFEVSPPETKEAYMYRDIFSKHFPSPSAAKTVPYGKSIACSTPAAIAWDKAFQDAADPSGRAIAGVHDKAY